MNGAILFGVISFTAGMTTGVHWWHAANGISIIILVAAIGTPIQFRLFRPVSSNYNDRSLKFIWAANVWFIVAGVLLVFGPTICWNLLTDDWWR